MADATSDPAHFARHTDAVVNSVGMVRGSYLEFACRAESRSRNDNNRIPFEGQLNTSVGEQNTAP
jgi:hypothetical protein